MCESPTRLSFAESLACPKLGRVRPFEARLGLAPTCSFCRRRSHPAPDVTSFQGEFLRVSFRALPKGMSRVLAAVLGERSWPRHRLRSIRSILWAIDIGI